jgi:hypothetical protein
MEEFEWVDKSLAEEIGETKLGSLDALEDDYFRSQGCRQTKPVLCYVAVKESDDEMAVGIWRRQGL